MWICVCINFWVCKFMFVYIYYRKSPQNLHFVKTQRGYDCLRNDTGQCKLGPQLKKREQMKEDKKCRKNGGMCFRLSGKELLDLQKLEVWLRQMSKIVTLSPQGIYLLIGWLVDLFTYIQLDIYYVIVLSNFKSRFE
eukprot:TRINITY_DN1176_c2_g1_i2.p2 TRINITY_DN1176_c2_g1~~TRINITY_DN1176_c2_g1_i2.p2  ORF type:complete len:137 (-),score=5.01 TRINITY_DN1176_c2_g1_i2:14-424(-)